MSSALLRPIDWRVIANAVEHYVGLGFTSIEVPWVVPDEVAAATAPAHVRPLTTRDGTLVGSAEQSLLHLAATGSIGPGRYVAVSPCFRDDAPDVLHGRHFVKVELMHLWPEGDPWAVRNEVILQARGFFLSQGVLATIDPNPGGELGQFDLVSPPPSGVELGSYGVRTATLGGREILWVYGTGVAEPRFSTVRAGGSAPPRSA